MKNSFILLTLLSMSMHACQLIVINNSPYHAGIVDNNTNHQYTLSHYNKATIGDGDKRADITVTFQGLISPKIVHLTQTACSENHKIVIYLNDVLDKNLKENASLFSINEE